MSPSHYYYRQNCNVRAVITDTSTFDYVEKLAAIGFAPGQGVSGPTSMVDHHVAGVQAFVALYRDEVWRPFVDAGLPADQWHTLADKTTQLRPLTISLGIQAFRRAIDQVVGKVAAEEAAKLDRQSPS